MIRSSFLLLLVLPVTSMAADLSPFGIAGGASWGLGSMKGAGGTYPSRTVNTLSLEMLPGYRFNQFLVGADLGVRFVGQNTKVSEAGNTNAKGKGFLGGLGAHFYPSEKWVFGASFYFLGNHNLSHSTSSGQEGAFRDVRGIKLSAGYFPCEMPLSVDLSFRHLSFREQELGSVTRDLSSDSLKHLSFALGLTYHLGSSEKKSTSPQEESRPQGEASEEDGKAEADVQEDESPAFSETADYAAREVNGNTVLTLPSDTEFGVSKSEITSEAKQRLTSAATKIQKGGFTKVQVHGFTDTSGNAAQNMRLSKARAEAVRAALLEGGLPASMVVAQGFGSKNPVDTNETAEGRSRNRRVEIVLIR